MFIGGSRRLTTRCAASGVQRCGVYIQVVGVATSRATGLRSELCYKAPNQRTRQERQPSDDVRYDGVSNAPESFLSHAQANTSLLFSSLCGCEQFNSTQVNQYDPSTVMLQRYISAQEVREREGHANCIKNPFSYTGRDAISSSSRRNEIDHNSGTSPDDEVNAEDNTESLSPSSSSLTSYSPPPPPPLHDRVPCHGPSSSPRSGMWSWWELFIRGETPEYPARRAAYNFLISQQIDPRKLSRAELAVMMKLVERATRYGTSKWMMPLPYNTSIMTKLISLASRAPLRRETSAPQEWRVKGGVGEERLEGLGKPPPWMAGRVMERFIDEKETWWWKLKVGERIPDLPIAAPERVWRRGVSDEVEDYVKELEYGNEEGERAVGDEAM